MRSILLSFLVAVGTFVPLAAQADEPASPASTSSAPASPSECPLDDEGNRVCPKVAFEVGVRTGFAVPLGSSVEGARLSNGVTGQVPILLDLGVRPDPHVFVGVYGQIAPLVLNDDLCHGGTCSGTDVRVGIQAHYHFRPTRRFDPWIGVGAGYEWLSASSSTAKGEQSVTLRGFELFNAQAGLDYRLCSGIKIGPFASFSIGEFSKVSVKTVVDGRVFEQSADVPQSAIHEWLTLGVRGAFDL